MWFLPAVLSQDPIVFSSGTFWARCCFCVCLNRFFFFPWACFCLPLKSWHHDRWPDISSDYVHASQKSESLRQATSIDQCSRTPKRKERKLCVRHNSWDPAAVWSNSSCSESPETVELRVQSSWCLRCRKQVWENKHDFCLCFFWC